MSHLTRREPGCGVEWVARGEQSIFTSGAQSDDRLNRRLSVSTLGLRSIVCVTRKVSEVYQV
jgi:hypothetical protein